MSLRLGDLSRWPMPGCSSREKVFLCSPFSYTWQLMPIHKEWLEECTDKYGFDNVDETLRHLIYLANSESKPTKRLIFRIKRCLHCHVGARAGQHRKVALEAQIHQFQWQWLQTVTAHCDIASVEKCVRIVCDFYQSRVKEALIEGGQAAADRRETELFGAHRLGCDERLTRALAKWKDHEQESENNNQQQQQEESSKKLLSEDPSACSEQDMLDALSRCQVGRKSATYAAAKGETAEETAARRAKERVLEESKEAKQNRALIRKALYM